jgi:hypothetical protein
MEREAQLNDFVKPFDKESPAPIQSQKEPGINDGFCIECPGDM